ncbi:lipid-A-disaccharide synthase [Devosia sp. XJ19-1]|uniref:Lipid-A-disaccharide synthase n=1 Tax=Devosia ureilytica TaxID=2952754 RepID=A0A9Q4FQC4_9HYPH|nr:lipid-A-disaccharide synthase [Devosia ureilytica]MCP8882282.1 lipid-A-disaccharide synthase [Devosia ureilytica]MCP8885831.1 lipid-A-disaccharide synthase [Devosia ureilytica]
MSDPLRLFILAGEPSGDRIAADLVARLRQRVTLSLSGVGGDELAGQGIQSLFPMSDLAVMGITDVLLNLPKLLWRLEQTARAILAERPDVVVLVDAQDFSRLLAAKLRKRGFSGTLILYVAPSVWARNPERAAKLKPLFDAVLAVLPFEPAAMDRLDGPATTYVGHPALAEGLPARQTPDRGALVLLPGSREGELRRHLPVLAAMVGDLAGRDEITEFVIPTLPRLRERLSAETRNWPVPVRLVDNRGARRELYASAIAAVCVSGTVTLELALARVPMAVIYALDGHQARVFDKLGRPQVSLPNIILDRPVVPEMVSAPLTADQVSPIVAGLLADKKARQDQIAAFGELYALMEAGMPPYQRQDPAEQVLSIWRNQPAS